MRRAAAAFAAALAAAGVAALAASLALRGEQESAPAPPAAGAKPAAKPPKREARGRRAPPLPASIGVDEVRPPGAPKPDAALSAEEDAEAQEEMLAYPDGASGPVVVGRVASPEDPDPDCWVALESVDDPAKSDPSEVETLPGGRFRLTKFPPGRYRVRARLDGAPAGYSRVVVATSGAVADAGVIRLPRPGCISGTVRDGEGQEVLARVHLLGRNPASLAAGVLASVNSLPLQGFEVAPHEAGDFVLAVEADEGWAVHRGTTGTDAISGADVRLEPWGGVRGRLEPPRPGAPAARLWRVEVEPLEAPPLGRAAERPALGTDGRVERLPAGRYRVTVRWTEEGAGPTERFAHAVELAVASGSTAEVVAPR